MFIGMNLTLPFPVYISITKRDKGVHILQIMEDTLECFYEKCYEKDPQNN